jgi:hypothetical protein
MAKRPVEGDGSTSGQPPIKKVQFEPIRIGPISTLEEMDMKVLQFQNKKLAQVSRDLYMSDVFGILNICILISSITINIHIFY